MIFSEIYSVYFNTVAEIIRQSLEGELDEAMVLRIIDELAFSESSLAILPAIKNEDWLVMNAAFETPLNYQPEMSLTVLQKRWLKALLSDPRIALFGVKDTGLAEVDPLFKPSDFIFFDQYDDGDPYTDLNYISNFQTILLALREKRWVNIEYANRYGIAIEQEYLPYKVEYSSKDDKFRLKTICKGVITELNIARIKSCSLGLVCTESEYPDPIVAKECSVTFLLDDTRKALDRVMLHFSDCRKQTQRIAENQYQVELWYKVQDETEMVIRILSFGPMITVIAPDNFIRQIKTRLKMQMSLAPKSCEH